MRLLNSNRKYCSSQIALVKSQLEQRLDDHIKARLQVKLNDLQLELNDYVAAITALQQNLNIQWYQRDQQQRNDLIIKHEQLNKQKKQVHVKTRTRPQPCT